MDGVSPKNIVAGGRGRDVEYVRRELTHPDGAFFAAQDATVRGMREATSSGAGEICRVLGAEMAEEFCRHYGVTESAILKARTC